MQTVVQVYLTGYLEVRIYQHGMKELLMHSKILVGQKPIPRLMMVGKHIIIGQQHIIL